MPLPRVIPALADLTQDIAGPLPVTLLHAWAAGSQDVETARALLQAFRIEGSVVATDTSGLSRMVEGHAWPQRQHRRSGQRRLENLRGSMARLPDPQPFQTTISGITLRGVFI